MRIKTIEIGGDDMVARSKVQPRGKVAIDIWVGGKPSSQIVMDKGIALAFKQELQATIGKE